MLRRLIKATTVLGCAAGLVGMMGIGVASAHPAPPTSHGPKPPVTATGTTTCNFHGTLSVNSAGVVSLRGNMTPRRHTKACTDNGGTKLRTGHLSHLAGTTTITGGLCSLVSGGSLPDLAGGTIRWAPRHKVASSTGVALTGGAVSVVTVGTRSVLQVAYSDGSVAAGSFTNASGASLTTTSRRSTADLTAACANGPVKAIAVNGTITL